MPETSGHIDFKGYIHICPECGYEDGFHVSFNSHGRTVAIILICPSCHSRFDTDWKINAGK